MSNMLTPTLQYTGQVQPKPGELDSVNLQPLRPYLPSPELVEVVNLAIQLERPLLIKGEPGSGKTRIAGAVAYELGLPLEAWYVKSTSRARDGLYTYDSIGRLRDAQLASAGRLSEPDLQRIDEPMAYVRWGPLGRAFRNTKRTVVLIDEIDKADIDFPNDLLLELDERRFVIDEVRSPGQPTEAEVVATEAPIVFITSNDEKDLPDAFLRRCIFHYVTFPDRDRLIQIVHHHFPVSPDHMVDAIVDRFVALRREMVKDRETGKHVSTSELIDWFRVLRHYPEDEILARLAKELLHPGVLLKNWDDYRRYGGALGQPEVT